MHYSIIAWLIDCTWVRDPIRILMHLGLIDRPFVPHGPQAYTLDILWLQKKVPGWACLSEAKASHSHRMWADISSSIPHLLHIGLSTSPSRWRCLLRVLCPVRRPVTTLAWVLLKAKNLALATRLGPDINPLAPEFFFYLATPCI